MYYLHTKFYTSGPRKCMREVLIMINVAWCMQLLIDLMCVPKIKNTILDCSIQLVARAWDCIIDMLKMMAWCYGLDVNVLMRMVNGNGRNIKVYYQNIPGYTISDNDIINCIETLLHKFQPDVLAIAEPSHSKIDIDWQNYRLIKGTQKDIKNVRLNALIKKDLQCELFEWKTELPMVGVKIEECKIVMTYREWNKGGVMKTNGIGEQTARWENFTNKVAQMKGKNCFLIGDMNYDFWRTNSEYQKTLEPIREVTRDNLMTQGWVQIITGDTRIQKFRQKQTQVGCLDHIYSKSTKMIQKIFNQNVLDHDHNCVAIELSSSRRVNLPQISEGRNIKNCHELMFDRVFNQTNPTEIYDQVTVDDTVQALTHKITLTLDILAPKKRRVISSKHFAPWMTDDIKELIARRNKMREVTISPP